MNSVSRRDEEKGPISASRASDSQSNASARPYRSTPVFDETTLPPALRGRHATRAGVWGVIRVIEGRLKLTVLEPPSEKMLDPATPGFVLPEQPHFVTPLGPMKMQVDFYDRPPGD